VRVEQTGGWCDGAVGRAAFAARKKMGIRVVERERERVKLTLMALRAEWLL
jgi:predicted Fe-Mo cluster-binding NifX family protein